jgi:hypothetical protein
MKTLLSLIAIAFLFTGCATPYDVKITQENTKRVVSNDGANKSIVKSKTDAIAKLASSYECSDPDSKDCGTAMAFSNVIGMQSIAGIQTEQYKGPIDKTGVDVQYKVAENGIPLAAVIGGTVTSTAAVKSDKGTTTVNADNGATVTNTSEENHSTALGEGASSNNTPNQDNSIINPVEEEVVE